MRLALDDDQSALVSAVNAVLDAKVTPAVLHARRDGGGLDRNVWSSLAELGVFALAVPEAAGGMGRPFIDLALVLEQVGRSGWSGPVLETTVVALPTLIAAAPEPVRDEWLTRLVDGSAMATASLTTERALAADADEADVIVLIEHDGATVAARSECSVEAQHSLDPARRPGLVTAHGGTSMAISPQLRSEIADRVAIAVSAQMVGNARHLLSATVAYAKDRRQFGRAIGSFQAVKHLLADLLLELEAAEAAVWVAALQVDGGDADARSIAAAVAVAHTTDTALRANHIALQVHGGIGYTWESDLQLWLKQGLVLARLLGPAHRHRQRAARLAGLGSIAT